MISAHHSETHTRITFVQGKVDEQRPRHAVVVGIQSNNVERAGKAAEPAGVNRPLRSPDVLPLMDAVLDDVL